MATKKTKSLPFTAAKVALPKPKPAPAKVTTPTKTSNSIFTKPFFTIGGQAERFQNVGATLKAAVTGKGVKSNTGNKVFDTALSTAASHPFITAGVVTGGVYALRAAPAVISAVGSKAAAIGGGSAALKGLAAPALFGIAGLGIGAALSGGGKATTGAQTTNPIQNPQINTQPIQNTDTSYRYDTNTDNSIWQNAGGDIGALSQSNPLTQSPITSPQQYTPSNLSAAQETIPQQTATSSSGINWLMIAAIGLGAMLLFDKKRR